MDHGLGSLLRSLHFPTNICWVHVARVMIVHAAHTGKYGRVKALISQFANFNSTMVQLTPHNR